MSRLRSFTLELNPPSDFAPLKSIHEETVKKILTESDRMARKASLDDKQKMHIVLITEEMISLLPHLMEYGSGKFWIDSTDDVFEMHILVTPKSSDQKGSGNSKNTDASKRTFISRIMDVFDKAASHKQEQNQDSETTSWSLGSYIENLKKQDRDSKAAEWDELEHSILANLADDVIVKSTAGDVDLVIIKKVCPRVFHFEEQA